MKTIIVGGNFGEKPKASKIVNILGEELSATIINGGTIEDLKNIKLTGYELIIWMANVDNNEEKYYPKKDTGAVLVVSKVDRGSRIDAVSRIFKMHGNAVILISKDEDNNFRFELIDALNNTWGGKIKYIPALSSYIKGLATWTFGSIRKSLKKNHDLEDLIILTKTVADNFEDKYGRFFGNCSTRCQSMFPSTRCFFSKRNVNKKRLSVEDMIYVQGNEYYSTDFDDKPSVDTPVQLALYNYNHDVNFMIHGHGFVEDAPCTEHYYPCGDMREVPECNKLMIGREFGVINLKKHGFLIYANNTKQLRKLVMDIKFINKEYM